MSDIPEEDVGFCLEMSIDDSRGVFEPGAKWENGRELKIKFLGGSPDLQEIVKRLAAQWTEIANLKFKYVGSSESADIRIAFNTNGSNWSFVGKDAEEIGPSQPTMQLSLQGQSAEMQRRRILHEFGHALGLHHEHQNPDVNIPWNPQGVYESYGVSPSNTEAQNAEIRARVDHNVLTPLPRSRVDNTPFDTESIMLYPIPRSWVRDPAFVRGWNTNISPTDRGIIAQHYPRA